MKVLLDECVPWPMHKILTGHTCSTVQSQGWGGIKNGDLLQLAEGKFVLSLPLTNIRFQQNITGRRLAILELSANDINRIQSARELIEETIETIGPDEFRRLILP